MIPHGCPGFENFNTDTFKKGYDWTWSTVGGTKSDPQCAKNTLERPPGSTPLHEILEEYADSQSNWIRDFVPTLEKMLANGYASGELHDGPDQWSDVQCSTDRFWVCYKLGQLSSPFYLVSSHDERVLQHSVEGSLELQSRKQIRNPVQLWQWAADGSTLINSLTKLPLVASGHGQWALHPWTGGGWYHPSADEKVLSSGDQCVSRGWSKSDEENVGTYECWGGPVQHWRVESA